MHSFGNWVVIKLTIHEKLQRCWCMSALRHFLKKGLFGDPLCLKGDSFRQIIKQQPAACCVFLSVIYIASVDDSNLEKSGWLKP